MPTKSTPVKSLIANKAKKRAQETSLLMSRAPPQPQPPQQPVFPLPENLQSKELLPKQQPKQTPLSDVKNADRIPPAPKTEVFRDEKGNLSGITTPEGKTFLGMNPEQVREFAAKEQAKKTLPEGTVEVGTQKKIEETMKEQDEAVKRLLNPQSVEPEQRLGSNTTDTAVGVGAGLLGSGAALSTIPTLLNAFGGAGAATTAGAAAGGTAAAVGTGLLSSTGVGLLVTAAVVLGKIALDKRKVTKESFAVFKRAKQEINVDLLNLANQGRYPPSYIVDQYEQNLANIMEARRELKAQTKNAVGRQLSGAMDELNAVEEYLQDEERYRADLIYAIMNPNPAIHYEYQTEGLNIDSSSS